MSYYFFKCKYSTNDSSQHYFNMCLTDTQAHKFEKGDIRYQYYGYEQYYYANIIILNKKQISKQTFDEIKDLTNNEYIFGKL